MEKSLQSLLPPSHRQRILNRRNRMSDCGCGRRPTGKCVGWHNLTEEQYQEKKAAYEAKQAAKSSAA